MATHVHRNVNVDSSEEWMFSANTCKWSISRAFIDRDIINENAWNVIMIWSNAVFSLPHTTILYIEFHTSVLRFRMRTKTFCKQKETPILSTTLCCHWNRMAFNLPSKCLWFFSFYCIKSKSIHITSDCIPSIIGWQMPIWVLKSMKRLLTAVCEFALVFLEFKCIVKPCRKAFVYIVNISFAHFQSIRKPSLFMSVHCALRQSILCLFYFICRLHGWKFFL